MHHTPTHWPPLTPLRESIVLGADTPAEAIATPTVQRSSLPAQAYEYQLCSRAEVERMKGAIQAAMEGVFFEYLDIVWEIGEAQQLRAYTRTAPYLDFTDTHAQLPTAEAAIQAATTLWQKWAHTFEAYKQVQQGLPDMFMGKLIPQNAQAHSKTDSNGRVMAPQRGIYRSWKVTYCVQLELMPQVFAVPENFVFTVEVVAIGKQFRLIGLEGTLPLMRSKTAAPVVLAAVPAGKFLWQLATESSKLFPFVQTYQEAVQDGKPVLLASEEISEESEYYVQNIIYMRTPLMYASRVRTKPTNTHEKLLLH